MKNKLIIASMALLGMAGFTSCVADKEPELKKPTEFVLNTPPAADQLYMFDCDSKGNSVNDITFTVSQPNYGVACVTTYKVQVAKSEADFALWDEQQKNEEGAEAQADDLPLAEFVDFSTENAKITIDGEKFCTAVNKVYGLTMQNVKDQSHPVAVRVHAEVTGAKNSAIWSNAITLKQVLSYVKPVPDQIWLIGAPQGWNITGDPKYVLTETEIGNKIYTGDFTIKAGEFMFRFYDQLGSWDHFSIGSQVEDNPLDIKVGGQAITKLPEEGITLPCLQEVGGVNPKGSWNIPGWEGGKVHIEVNLNTNQVTFTPGQSKKVYLIGACNGWDINKSALYLTETEDGSNIYSGTVAIDAGAFTFRFYSKLGDWETNSIGSQEPDENTDITVPAAGITLDCVNGKGKWNDASWAGGNLEITLDLNTMKVTFKKA